MTKKLTYKGKPHTDPDTNRECVNGIDATEIAREHAIFREVIRAIYRGEMDDYCDKYGIQYDNVYTTQLEAIVEYVEKYTYICIDTDAPEAI